MSSVFLKKLCNAYIWKRLLYERLSEPLHLNFLSIIALAFGNLRHKIDFDLIIRQHHAYAVLDAADQARQLGHERVSIFEFGVAAGAGLLNLQSIARRVTAFTGVGFDIYGFDTGVGMPPPASFKDHPELYQTGDFPMDFSRLAPRLEESTKLMLGPIGHSINSCLEADFSRAPIGFISIDVDYYTSTVDALRLLKHSASNFLPRVVIYLDDVELPTHNSYCGEQAAVREFTSENSHRPIEKHPFLRGFRLFKNARWIDHIYQCHILDHPVRNDLLPNRNEALIGNPYL